MLGSGLSRRFLCWFFSYCKVDVFGHDYVIVELSGVGLDADLEGELFLDTNLGEFSKILSFWLAVDIVLEGFEF